MTTFRNKENILKIGNYFINKGYPVNFVMGLLGNICSETAGSFNPNQVQLSYLKNKAYGIATCDDYVNRVDAECWVDPQGRWFGEDRIGFGLSQLTSSGRKTKYYEFCKGKDKSVGDLQMQLEWIDIEIYSTGYANVRKAIKENWSIEECARVICTDFEKPAKKNELTTQNTRINYALEIYEQFFKEDKKAGDNNMSDKVLAINAGHWNGNPKGVPNNMPLLKGTREFVLNNKVVNAVVKKLSAYKGIKIVLNYDVTGKDGNQKTNGLDVRIKKAEDEKADMYLSIHHNGGGGRGTVVFCKKNDKVMGSRLYNNIILFTDSRGNRATPVNTTSNLIEILKPTMKSYLIECAFMDNAEDVKLIAQDDWADKVSNGIVKFVVEEWGLTMCTDVVEPQKDTTPTNSSSVEMNLVDDEPTISYTIKKGDTLGAIASRFGVTAVAIARVNPEITNLNKIYVGQTITIPRRDAVRLYIVESGDTLSKIGKKENVSWRDIAKKNNLSFPYLIHKGEVLFIP